jgi:hypothetical protein
MIKLADRPVIVVGDKVKRRNDPYVYDILRVDQRGTLLWTVVLPAPYNIPESYTLSAAELESQIFRIEKPDGSVWEVEQYPPLKWPPE